jgi:hypothetical protein
MLQGCKPWWPLRSAFVMAMLDVIVVNVALVAIRADLDPPFPALV